MSITVLLLVIIVLLLLPVPWLLYLMHRNLTTIKTQGGPKPEGRGYGAGAQHRQDADSSQSRGGPKPEGRGYTPGGAETDQDDDDDRSYHRRD